MRTFYGKTPTSPSYGFVKFKSDAMALAALHGMHGREFNGHTMTVRLANNDTTGAHRHAALTPPSVPQQVTGGTNLYVSGLPPETRRKQVKGGHQTIQNNS